MTAGRTGPPEDPPTWRFQLGALLLVLLVAGSFVVGVLVPYLVNDLHRIPLAEVAGGGYDPKDLWPQDGPLVVLQGVAVLLAHAGRLVLVGVAVVVGWTLWEWRGRTTRPARLVGRTALGLALLVLAGLWSPWGVALMTWVLD